MTNFDFTNQGRRPSAAQIVKAWKAAGKPKYFTVEYGETFAEFQCLPGHPLSLWHDGGNGCRGVDRNAILKALNMESAKAMATADDLY